MNMASFGLDDLFSGSALAGAASGAGTGFMAGGPWGALAGGVAGGAIGAYSNYSRDKATQQQKSNLDQLMSQMRAHNQIATSRYLQDIQKAQSYFGPAQQTWDRLYGTGQPMTTGKGSWKGTG